MYASEIALNELEPDLIVSDLIDHDAAQSGDVLTVLHVHSYHSRQFFSKMALADGWYDNVNTTGTDTSDVRFYALEMALRGNNIGGRSIADEAVALRPRGMDMAAVNDGAQPPSVKELSQPPPRKRIVN